MHHRVDVESDERHRAYCQHNLESLGPNDRKKHGNAYSGQKALAEVESVDSRQRLQNAEMGVPIHVRSYPQQAKQSGKRNSSLLSISNVSPGTNQQKYAPQKGNR